MSTFILFHWILTFWTWELRLGEVKKLIWDKQRLAEIQTKFCWHKDCDSQNVGISASPGIFSELLILGLPQTCWMSSSGNGAQHCGLTSPLGGYDTHWFENHSTLLQFLWDSSPQRFNDLSKINPLFMRRTRTRTEPSLLFHVMVPGR